MTSVIRTAALLGVLSLSLPFLAQAQDPEPAPAPAPAPPPPAPPPDVAIPRAERPSMRDGESRVPQRSQGRAVRDSERAPSRAVDNPVEVGGARRRAVEQEQVSAPSRVSAAASDDEPDAVRAQRRGAVRRPPSDGRSVRGGQGSRDRAVPRASVPRERGRVFVYPDYYRYYNRYYDSWGYGAFGLGYFYYSPWGWNPGYYAPSYGYGYGGGRYGYDIGTVKLKVKPRDAEVYVDGYFTGQVDDFDGFVQALRLNSGGYQIEVRKPGFESLVFDVRVQPDRNITFRGELKPLP